MVGNSVGLLCSACKQYMYLYIFQSDVAGQRSVPDIHVGDFPVYYGRVAVQLWFPDIVTWIDCNMSSQFQLVCLQEYILLDDKPT